MRAWVFDLDGTITDTRHRDHLNPRMMEGYEGNGDKWVPYSMAGDKDDAILPVIAMMRGAPLAVNIWIITGRTNLARDLTEHWLEVNRVPHYHLWMRKEGDHRPNVELKLARLDALESRGHSVELWVDDYPRVTKAMRKRGIPTITVACEVRDER